MPRRPQPGAGQPPAAARGPATCSASLRVTVFSPDDLDAGEGRAGRAAALPRRHARGAGRRSTTRCGSSSTGSCASATRCSSQAGGRLDERRRVDARRVGRQAGRRRRAASGTPGRRWSSGSTPLRRARPTTQLAGAADDGRAALRAAVAARRAWPRRWPTARGDDVRRGVSTVGPHRDELDAVDRRAAGAHPRLAGRAAHPGAGAAPRRPPPGRRAHRLDAGARARRRVLRARPRPGRRAARPPARRPDRAHDGAGGCPPRRAPERGARASRRPARSSTTIVPAAAVGGRDAGDATTTRCR